MRKFRSGLAVVLILAVAMSAFMVIAEEVPPCVEGYRKLNGAFMGRLETLKTHQQVAMGAEWVGVIGGAVCAAKRKSIMGIVLCGIAGEMVAVPAAVYSNMTGREMSELNETYGMEDYFITYQTYFARRVGTHMVSDEVKAFMGAIGADPSKTQEATDALKELMETGVLCEGGNVPKTSLKSVAELIRQKMSL